MLIKCAECGHDVSEHAQSCPNCGCPVSFSLKFPEPEIEDSDQLEELQEKLNEIEQQLEQIEDSDQLEELTSGENENPDSGSEVEEEIKSDKTLRKLAIWSVLLAVLILVPFIIIENKTQSVSSGRTSSSYKSSSSNSGSSSSSSKSTGSSYKGSSGVSDDYKGVLVACLQEAVKSQLKSPSSAKFPKSFSEYTFTNADGTWFVTGWVEAQNSFGASIRQNCDCFVMQEGTKFVPFLVTIGEESYFVE